MWKYVVKRIFLAIVTIFVIAAITFFAMHAVPGGPFNKEKATSPAVQQMLEERFHLDEPVIVQFGLYLQNIFTKFDFGISLKTNRDITTIITECFGISAMIGGCAIVVSIVFGILFGCIAALRRNKLADRTIVFFSTLFVAVPSFVLATLLMLVFCMQLGWIPVWSVEKGFIDYILPVISLAAYPMAYIIRLTKSSMLDVLEQDYIRTAKAKGVSKWRVIFKHALRNALLPVITYIGPMSAYTLTGSLVVENIFTIGGLGSQFVSAINNRDYPLIMATTIFLATIMVIMTLISDLLYKFVDPKIKFD